MLVDVCETRAYGPGMALIGYARVSTIEQDASLQHDALNAAGCIKVFTDQGSGKLESRPQLDRALDHLRPGDTLVVWRLDRLGRSMQHLLHTVNSLAEDQVGFRSLTEAIDTTTAAGKFVFHVFGALAEFEREIIRERTLAGLEAARARGRVGGRRSVMTAEKLTIAKSMLSERVHTAETIARTIGVSRATLYRHLDAAGTGRPSAALAGP